MTSLVNEEEEFMNFTEITNDLLHNLHVKDVELLKSLSIDRLSHEQHEFITHILNYYKLNNPHNPLLETYMEGAKRTPEEIALRIAKAVWVSVRVFENPSFA